MKQDHVKQLLIWLKELYVYIIYYQASTCEKFASHWSRRIQLNGYHERVELAAVKKWMLLG